MYPIHRKIPINIPGLIISLWGIPPENKNKIDAIKYLKKTTVVGDRSSNKFFTIINVEPNNKAASIKAFIARSFLFLNMRISEH